MKGRTRWFPWNASRVAPVKPVRVGYYECLVRINNAGPRFLWSPLWYDGIGFLVPFPMIVDYWRGQTKSAHGIKKGGV